MARGGTSGWRLEGTKTQPASPLARPPTEEASARTIGAALTLLFREFLDPRAIDLIVRAKGPQRVPTVLSHPEARRVISHLRGKYSLIGSLLYGTGMRLSECISVRTKDIDFDLSQIMVRDGKGAKDRYVMLPDRVRGPLGRQIEIVQELHESDRQAGGGWARLPGALHRKKPEAGYSLLWQFVFPSSRGTRDAATKRHGRYHLHPSAVQRTVKSAVRRSGITKDASCHTFRHTFATELVRSGCDIRRVQELLGHKDIRQTMVYLHVVEQTGLGIRSPLDQPDPDE